MASNYTVTECHNSSGGGDDLVWYNIEINDLTKEELEKIIKIVEPMYKQLLKTEQKEFEKMAIRQIANNIKLA